MTRALYSVMLSLALAAPALSMALPPGRSGFAGVRYRQNPSQSAKSLKSQVQEITLRGHAICLDEQGKPSTTCTEGAHRFGFQTSDNKLYSFLAADSMAEMFESSAVRERLLQITAASRGDNRLELIKILSVREGKLYDIFFFCDVCNITAYAPGPCACCRKELELKETPAPERE